MGDPGGRRRPPREIAYVTVPFAVVHAGTITIKTCKVATWKGPALVPGEYAIALRPLWREHDAAIWAMDPGWLNKRVVCQCEVVPPGAEIGISEKDANRYSPWLPDRYSAAKLPKLPVGVYPTHTVRRIRTQKSCFTIHGSEAMSRGGASP